MAEDVDLQRRAAASGGVGCVGVGRRARGGAFGVGSWAFAGFTHLVHVVLVASMHAPVGVEPVSGRVAGRVVEDEITDESVRFESGPYRAALSRAISGGSGCLLLGLQLSFVLIFGLVPKRARVGRTSAGGHRVCDWRTVSARPLTQHHGAIAGSMVAGVADGRC